MVGAPSGAGGVANALGILALPLTTGAGCAAGAGEAAAAGVGGHAHR